MTEPIPVRMTEAVRIVRAAEVVETVRVVEYATPPPAVRPELESGSVGRECDCALCRSALHLVDVHEPRRALPPGRPVPARPWWRRR